jgi:hypothetical protein
MFPLCIQKLRKYTPGIYLRWNGSISLPLAFSKSPDVLTSIKTGWPLTAHIALSLLCQTRVRIPRSKPLHPRLAGLRWLTSKVLLSAKR